MDAFLLSAGLGTRLRPLTNTTPKPMIELAGKPLIAWNLESLKNIGCSRVVINTSYLAQQIIDFVSDGSKWGLEVIYSYEEELLDTGGGLKNIFNFIRSENFITWNADVFVDPKFSIEADGFIKLESQHNKDKAPIITILVRGEDQENISEYGELLVDSANNLVGFLGTRFFEDRRQVSKVMFAGISIMSKRIQQYFPTESLKFSITSDIFPKILLDSSLEEGEKIRVSYCNHYWNDVGTPQRLDLASNKLK